MRGLPCALPLPCGRERLYALPLLCAPVPLCVLPLPFFLQVPLSSSRRLSWLALPFFSLRFSWRPPSSSPALFLFSRQLSPFLREPCVLRPLSWRVLSCVLRRLSPFWPVLSFFLPLFFLLPQFSLLRFSGRELFAWPPFWLLLQVLSSALRCFSRRRLSWRKRSCVWLRLSWGACAILVLLTTYEERLGGRRCDEPGVLHTQATCHDRCMDRLYKQTKKISQVT